METLKEGYNRYMYIVGLHLSCFLDTADIARILEVGKWYQPVTTYEKIKQLGGVQRSGYSLCHCCTVASFPGSPELSLQVRPCTIKVFLPHFYLWRCSHEKKIPGPLRMYNFNFVFWSRGAWERG